MTLWRNSMKDTDPMPKGGYARGFLAAAVVSSVSFIAISTAFPSNPFPTVNQTAQQTAVAPTTVELVPMDATENASLGLSPSLQTPAFGAPATESSGLTVASNTSSPNLPVSTQPTTLNVANDGAQVAVAHTESTARPTAGLDLQTASIAQPSTESSPVALEPTVNVAAVATTEPNLPPIPSVNLDGAFANNAQIFSDTGGRGLVSLVLKVDSIDQVRAAFALAASVTLAIDVNNPEAANIAAAYRQVGGESLLLLPEANGFQNGESHDAVKTSLSAVMPESMQVIGMIDPTGRAVPNDAMTVNSVMRTLAPWGHAIVSPQSSDTVSVAQQAGIPAISFATEIDPTKDRGLIVADINRALSGVSQNGAVVLYGTADEETIAALSTWLAGTTASQVTMAPVSASINRN